MQDEGADRSIPQGEEYRKIGEGETSRMDKPGAACSASSVKLSSLNIRPGSREHHDLQQGM